MTDPLLIDFQLSVAPLLAVVRNELRKMLHFCVPPFEVQGLGTVYLDHVEVPTADGFPDSQLPFAAGFVRRSSSESENLIAHGSKPIFGDPLVEFDDLPNYDPEIVVPLRLHVMTDSMIENGDEPIASDGLVLRLVFVVHAQMLRSEFDQDGDPLPWAPSVTIQVSGVDFGLLSDQISVEQQQHIRTKVLGKSIALPVNLAPLKAVLKDTIPLDVFNVGVSIDVPHNDRGHATRLAFRWEVNGPADSLGAWAAFLDGQLGNAPGEPDGCLLSVPAGLLTSWSEAMFADRIDKQASKPDAEFSVDTWPKAVWLVGLMQTSFKIDVFVPVCPDIGVTVTVNSVFSLAGGQLVTTSTITRDADDWDVWVCSGGGPTKVFDAIAGAIVADVYNPGIEEKVGQLPGGCEWTVEDEEITCTYPLSLPFGDIAATITQLLPTLDALLLAGVVDVEETAPSAASFNLNPKLGWGGGGGLCDDSPMVIDLTLASVYPGSVCDFAVEDDTVHQFTPYVHSNGHAVRLYLPITGIVGPTEPVVIPGEPGRPQLPDGSYFKDPYLLKVRIWTSDGIGLVASSNVLPMPPKSKELTPLEQAELAARKKLNCQTWAVWQPEQIFRFRWLPDPPWEKVLREGIEEHLWAVLVTDELAGREIAIDGGSGRIASATVAAAGFAHLELLFPAGADDEIVLSTPEDTRAESDHPGALHLRQTMLVPTARVSLAAPCEAVVLSAFSPELAWCVTAAGVFAYRIDRPGAPAVAQRLEDPGVRGVIPLSRGRLLAWGLQGIVIYDARERRQHAVISSEPIVDLAPFGRTLYALTTHSVRSFDLAGQDGRIWPRPDHTRLVGCTSRALVVGSPRGLTVYDRGAPDSSRPLAEVTVHDATALVQATGPAGEHKLVVRSADGSSVVLDLREPAAPQRTAAVAVDRRSVVRRLGRTLARVSDDGSALEVYRVDSELLLNKMQLEQGATMRAQREPHDPSLRWPKSI